MEKICRQFAWWAPRRGDLQKLRSRRRGTSLVEAAICLPVFVSMILGMMQLVNMVYFRQKVSMAGFIGMQALAQPGVTDDYVKDKVTDLLSERGIAGCTVTIDPPDILADADPGVLYTITVKAPMLGNVPPPILLPVPAEYTIELSLYR